MNNELFQLETFARSGFRVRLSYVDIAEDLIAGILLGQIVYWYMPNEQGKSKLRVKKNGEFWLAKGREDWKNEIRITPKQYDRAIKILIDKGLVEVQKFKFNGAPTNHIKLNISEVTEKVKSILTFGENPNSPLGEMELTETVNSLTKITTEITTKNNICAAKADTKKKSAKHSYSDDFEEIWSIYPKKRNKPKAYQRYKEALDKNHSHDDIKYGITCYAKECERNGTEITFIKMMEGFLNDERYLEYKKPEQKQEQTANFDIDNLLD
ncbi:replication protein [Bacillus cereus]|uniref:replication protein n=1 Tax=Bacillus cereus TaxID=1396 RepID=UPI002AC001A7|nr:replication protein [Bacillus cereus]MDZ4454615.1 replication protein [Bacillus cereus]